MHVYTSEELEKLMGSWVAEYKERELHRLFITACLSACIGAIAVLYPAQSIYTSRFTELAEQQALATEAKMIYEARALELEQCKLINKLAKRR